MRTVHPKQQCIEAGAGAETWRGGERPPETYLQQAVAVTAENAENPSKTQQAEAERGERAGIYGNPGRENLENEKRT